MSSKRWTLIGAVLGSAIVFLDSTVVNVALPRIGRELPRLFVGVLEGQSYIYGGYLLTLSALLILAGALNDFYGRRRMFVVGLIGFGLMSVLCGISPNTEFLIAARILQGAAGALLVPGSLSLITANFQGEEQGRAFGIWAGASAGTTILGPFVGGLLVDTLTWRAAFLINVPLVLLAIYAMRFVPESRDEEATGQFDWLGAIVIAIGLGGLAFGAIYGGQRNWQDPLAFAAVGVGAVAIVVFPFLQARSSHPLVPLRLFRSRNFAVTNVSTLVIYGALYVSGYNLTLFMQGTVGYTAAAAGLSFVPGTLFLVFFSSRFGGLAAKYGPRWFMAAGPLIMAAGVAWYVRLPAGSQAWILDPGKPASFVPPASYLIDVLPGSLLFGIGLMVMVAPLTTAVMTSVPVHNSGVASAINNAISRIGPQLAGAAIFVAITATFYSNLATRAPGLNTTSPDVRAQVSPLNRPAAPSGGKSVLSPDPAARQRQEEAIRQASADAFHIAMLVSAGLLVVGGVVNALWIQNPARAPGRDAEQTTAPAAAAS
jgi:EmrB/QacA subfamily drug resistance transporter